MLWYARVGYVTVIYLLQFVRVQHGMKWYWPENFQLPTFLHRLSARFACSLFNTFGCFVLMNSISVLANSFMLLQFEIFNNDNEKWQWSIYEIWYFRERSGLIKVILLWLYLRLVATWYYIRLIWNGVTRTVTVIQFFVWYFTLDSCILQWQWFMWGGKILQSGVRSECPVVLLAFDLYAVLHAL